MFCVHLCVVASHKLQTREDGTVSLILSRILIGIERGHNFCGGQSKECRRCVQLGHLITGCKEEFYTQGGSWDI